MSDDLKYKGFYEILYVVHPDTDEAGQKEVSAKVQRMVTEHGGQILKEEVWGKRRLAYEIQKVWEGTYVWVYFRDLGGRTPAALEGMIHTEARIIRHVVIALPKAKLLQDEQQALREQAAAERAATEAANAAARAAAEAAAAQPEPIPEPIAVATETSEDVPSPDVPDAAAEA